MGAAGVPPKFQPCPPSSEELIMEQQWCCCIVRPWSMPPLPNWGLKAHFSTNQAAVAYSKKSQNATLHLPDWGAGTEPSSGTPPPWAANCVAALHSKTSQNVPSLPNWGEAAIVHSESPPLIGQQWPHVLRPATTAASSPIWVRMGPEMAFLPN